MQLGQDNQHLLNNKQKTHLIYIAVYKTRMPYTAKQSVGEQTEILHLPF